MDVPTALSEAVSSAVERVFATMISLQAGCTGVRDFSVSQHDSLGEVTGSVSFVGQITGVIYLSMTPKLAQVATQQILGGDTPLTEREENDVIGELTNMVTGNVKTAMADKGYNSQLSIPSVLRGQAMSLSGKGYETAIEIGFEIPLMKEKFQVLALAKVN